LGSKERFFRCTEVCTLPASEKFSLHGLKTISATRSKFSQVGRMIKGFMVMEYERNIKSDRRIVAWSISKFLGACGFTVTESVVQLCKA